MLKSLRRLPCQCAENNHSFAGKEKKPTFRILQKLFNRKRSFFICIWNTWLPQLFIKQDSILALTISMMNAAEIPLCFIFSMSVIAIVLSKEMDGIYENHSMYKGKVEMNKNYTAINGTYNQ